MKPEDLIIQVKKLFQQAFEKSISDYHNSDFSDAAREGILADFRKVSAAILNNTEFWVAKDYDDCSEDKCIQILREEQIKFIRWLEVQMQGQISGNSKFSEH